MPILEYRPKVHDERRASQFAASGRYSGFVAIFAVCISQAAPAASAPAENFAVHGQFTYTEQAT